MFHGTIISQEDDAVEDTERFVFWKNNIPENVSNNIIDDVYDLAAGDITETSTSQVTKLKGTSTVLKSKTISGSFLPTNVTITTVDS